MAQPGGGWDGRPILKAAHAAGGLRRTWPSSIPEQQRLAKSILGLGKQYDAFQKSLEPQVLGIFGKGIVLAGHLMNDLQPIAKATGIALEHVLGRIDAEFRSGTWQKFFTWMAQNAGPDINLLGDAFINLLDALPQILEDLQPVATGLLKVTDAAAKALGPLGKLGDAAVKSNQAQMHAASSLDSWTTKITNAVPGFKAVNDSITADQNALKRLFGIAPSAGDATKKVGDQAQTSAVHVQSMADAVNNPNKAESTSPNTQLDHSNALITAANDAKTLRDDLKLSSGQVGLHTQAQRNSFSAANQYISDLSNAAKQAVASGKGAKGAASAIQSGLPTLERAAAHNRTLWQTVQTLKDWLDKLRLEKPIQEKINVLGLGKWSVAAATHAIAQGPGGSAAKAAGGLITGGIPGRDSVLATLMPGEVIIPTRMVALAR